MPELLTDWNRTLPYSLLFFFEVLTATGPVLVDTRMVDCEPFICRGRWREAALVQALRHMGAPQLSGALPSESTRTPERKVSGMVRLTGPFTVRASSCEPFQISPASSRAIGPLRA